MERSTHRFNMKTALLIGCGGTRGEDIVNGCLDANYNVINIGSSKSSIPNVTNYTIHWDNLHISQLHKILTNIKTNIDFIFFNQNASSLSTDSFTGKLKTLDLWKSVKHWTNSYWLSCQLPFTLIHTLEKNINKETKIGWMLSSFVFIYKKGVDAHADYSGYKFTNYLIMKNFNKKYNCFGINPDFTTSNSSQKLYQLITDILNNKQNINGQMFEM